MQRFGRIMIAAGVLAALGLTAAGLLGYRGVQADQEVRLHVLVGLGALLVFVLSHLWVLFYLTGAVRVLRRAASPETVRREAGLFGFKRHTLPPLLAAVVLALGCFLLGIGVYSGRFGGGVHAAAFYLTLVAEAWAAQREWRTVGAAERVVRSVRAAG
ncbi:MAG: hypothetical protein PVG07_03595 [Acidobacteriota bacterium]|jgi:hypothetical protein